MRRFFYSHSGIIWKSDVSLTTLTTLTNACDTFISFPIQDSVEFHGCYNCQSCQSCQSVKVSNCTFPYLHLQIPLVSLSVHKGNEGKMKGK